MSDLSFLSKLVKKHLPEGKVDSKVFLDEVIKTYQDGNPEEIKQKLCTCIEEGQRQVSLNTEINIPALSTTISPIPYPNQ